jgi:hypothetical protein
MFPKMRSISPDAAYRQARALCARCPVVEQCGKAGRGERFGVWGGTDPAQRSPAKLVRFSAA